MRLRGKAWRVDESSEFEIHKEVLSGVKEDPRTLDLTLIVPWSLDLRLDRLLARELGLSRAAL